MNKIFLIRDTREQTTYKEFIGWTTRSNGILIKKVKLFDSSIGAYRKQKVRLKIIEKGKRIVFAEVI